MLTNQSGMITIHGDIPASVKMIPPTQGVQGMYYLEYALRDENIYQWSKVTVRTDHKTYMTISPNNPSIFLRKRKRHFKTVNYNQKIFNAWKRIFGVETC